MVRVSRFSQTVMFTMVTGKRMKNTEKVYIKLMTEYNMMVLLTKEFLVDTAASNSLAETSTKAS